MKNFIKRIYKLIVPVEGRVLISKCIWIIIQLRFRKQHKCYEKTLLRLKNKEKIKVAFTIKTTAMWKLDELYWLMEKSGRFEPIVVICPWLLYENSNMYDLLNQIELFCKKKRYNYINTYDKNTHKWKNIKKIIEPDIVFFFQPYFYSKRKYNAINFLENSLICYVPYSFMIRGGQQKKQFNLLFHNLMWRGFYETPLHKAMAEKYADNKGTNIVVAGFTLFDEFDKIKQDNLIKDIWKIKDRKFKRIIWAPHWTVSNIVESQFTCFLTLFHVMIDIAEKYKHQIQIAFKPHPRLKFSLYSHSDWGEKRTEEYYNKWRNIENGQLEEDEYTDLFLTSDAMILDSVSFICEYLYTGNPLIFTMLDRNIKHSFNEFGEIVFQKIYHSYSKEDIEKFIENVVIEGKDVMQNERINFFNTQLVPPNNISASQNIFNYLASITK
jgi:hypothetical protein